MVAVENAWMLMANGMFSHEYILNVEPNFIMPRQKKLYNKYIKDNIENLTQNMLNEKMSFGFLEHAYNKRNSIYLKSLIDKINPGEMSVGLAQRFISIFDEEDCFLNDDRYVIDFKKLPNTTKGLPSKTIEEIDFILKSTGLYFFPATSLDIIILRNQKINPIDYKFSLLGTCEINKSDCVFKQTEDLLIQLASQWMYGFIMAREQPDFVLIEKWISPWTGNKMNVKDFIIEIFAHSIKVHFYRVFSELEPDNNLEKEISYEEEKLLLVKDFVYSLEKHLLTEKPQKELSYNNLSVCDLLWTFYPGKKRYEKYQIGLGIGQSGSLEAMNNQSQKTLKTFNSSKSKFLSTRSQSLKNNYKNKKIFIAFEGTDASGKTSLRKHLFNLLEKSNIDVCSIISFGWLSPQHTRVITETRYHNKKHTTFDLLNAYVEDKKALSNAIIKPHLNFRNIISDRYIVSDIVYNKVMYDIQPYETYQAYCKNSIIFPDLIVFIDTPPKISFERNLNRLNKNFENKHPWDEYEKQKLIYELYNEILFNSKYPAFNITQKINNHGTLLDAMQELEKKILPYFIANGKKMRCKKYMDVIFKKAKKEDFYKIIELSKLLEQENLGYGFVANTMDDLRNNDVWVGLTDNNIIAYMIGLKKHAEHFSILPKNTDYFEIEELYVEKKYRKNSIGSSFLKYIENEVRKLRVDHIILSSSIKDNDIIQKFYKINGYNIWTTTFFKHLG